jgi:8-amino-7-oxononanoate synthase
MNSNLDYFLQEKLLSRKKEGHLRQLNDFKHLVDFSSNDYLGLAAEAKPIAFQQQAGSSRLIFGNAQEFDVAEQHLADYFDFPAALIFNSGYAANLGLMSAVFQKGDLVLFDALSHASIKDGIRLSNATAFKFKHNDFKDLKRLLMKHKDFKSVFVVVEGLYSMHGDFSDKNELLPLKEEFDFTLITDEAHSAGVIGANGTGVFSFQEAEIKVVTFGKAFGLHGACVFGSETLKSYLINFSRPFIYTTALPIDLIKQIPNILVPENINSKREKLFTNIQFFRLEVKKHLGDDFLTSDEASPIQRIAFGSKEILVRVEKELLTNGFACKAIYPPTVPSGEECLRVSIHANQQEKDMLRFIQIMKSVIDD